jgi:hypothetical protein
MDRAVFLPAKDFHADLAALFDKTFIRATFIRAMLSSFSVKINGAS